jgi:Gpi18-like mannosyltransferase
MMPPKRWRALLAILFVAAALRVLAIRGLGYDPDMNTLAGWAEQVAHAGIGRYYQAGGHANYPPALYLLWPLGRTLDGEALRSAIRALSIPFDLGIGVVLYGIARRGGERAGLWAAAAYLLNPVTILVGSFWGQLDALGMLPMVASIWATSSRRFAAASALAVVAALMKTQFAIAAMVLAAVLAMGIRARDGLRNAAIAAVVAVATFALIMAPLRLGLRTYVELLRRSVDLSPVTSSFAFNAWGLLTGFLNKDGPLFYVGAALLIVGVILALSLLRVRRDLVGLLAVGFLLALALYFLPTRVHERYLIGAIVLLAPIAALYPALRIPYVALSAAFGVTLLYVLGRGGAFDPALRGAAMAPPLVVVLVIAVTGCAFWCAVRLKAIFLEAHRDLGHGRGFATPELA